MRIFHLQSPCCEKMFDRRNNPYGKLQKMRRGNRGGWHSGSTAGRTGKNLHTHIPGKIRGYAGPGDLPVRIQKKGSGNRFQPVFADFPERKVTGFPGRGSGKGTGGATVLSGPGLPSVLPEYSGFPEASAPGSSGGDPFSCATGGSPFPC